jgi:E3 SUMO-protein ligase PIAS1
MLDEETRALLKKEDQNNQHRIYFFISKSSRIRSVHYPYNFGIAVNGVSLNISAHLGSTKKLNTQTPVDLTPYLKIPGENKIITIGGHSFGTALDVQIYLVRAYSDEELIQRLPVLSKMEFLNSRKQSETLGMLAAVSDTVTLKDPLVLTRITVPIKSKSCRHFQCFDATIFFAMNRKIPTWDCPICSKNCKWESFAVDGMFKEILASCDEGVDAVTILPDGSWTAEVKKEPKLDETYDRKPSLNLLSILTLLRFHGT